MTALQVCIGHCGTKGTAWWPPVLAAVVAAGLAAGLSYWFAGRREQHQVRRRQRAAAMLAHEDLWLMQSVIARALHDVLVSHNRSHPGQWWADSATPDLLINGDGLSELALAFDRHALAWYWVSNAYQRIRQLKAEATDARGASGSVGPHIGSFTRALHGQQPGRLCESYLRLEVARRPLAKLVGVTYRPHDEGWEVPDAVPVATSIQAAALNGPLPALNESARLKGRQLSIPGQDSAGSQPSDWRDLVLQFEPRQTALSVPFPWDACG